jgi:hypothetical protein
LAADGFLAFVSTRDFYSRDGRENIPRNLAELLHMGISIRHILVDQNDAVIRLSNRLFQRLWDNSQGDTVPQFAGCRVRWAEAVVELKDRKPVDMLRVVFSYLYFDDQGHLDREVMQNGALMDKSRDRRYRSDEVRIGDTRVGALCCSPSGSSGYLEAKPGSQ